MLFKLCFNTKLHDFYKSDVLVVSLSTGAASAIWQLLY